MADDWQPMETAPRDRPILFGYTQRSKDHLMVEIGKWADTGVGWCAIPTGLLRRPAYWMEVPRPPFSPTKGTPA